LRVLEITNRHLGERGFAGVSYAAIAEEAATTRQALYRRWPTKDLLVADAIRMAMGERATAISDDPRVDLERELADLLDSTDARTGTGLAGAMLQSSTPDEARDCYRSHVLLPRRQRLLDILVRAQRLGLIDAQADLDAAVGAAIGSSYVAEIAGGTQSDWPARTAAFVWRAVGGATAEAHRTPTPVVPIPS
jgi:AcrR family transcriptional regulator